MRLVGTDDIAAKLGVDQQFIMIIKNTTEDGKCCGVLWCAVVCCGVWSGVWCVVWCGVVWCVVLCCIVLYSAHVVIHVSPVLVSGHLCMVAEPSCVLRRWFVALESCHDDYGRTTGAVGTVTAAAWECTASSELQDCDFGISGRCDNTCCDNSVCLDGRHACARETL